MQPPVLRTTFSLALCLVDLGKRCDDVVGPAQLAQGKLDARSRRLLGLKENEFMGGGDDHARPPASLCKSKSIRQGRGYLDALITTISTTSLVWHLDDGDLGGEG